MCNKNNYIYNLEKILLKNNYKYSLHLISNICEIEKSECDFLSFLNRIKIDYDFTNDINIADFILLDNIWYSILDHSTTHITLSNTKQNETFNISINSINPKNMIYLKPLNDNVSHHLNYNYYLKKEFEFLYKRKLVILSLLFISLIAGVLVILISFISQIIFDLYIDFKNEAMILKSLTYLLFISITIYLLKIICSLIINKSSKNIYFPYKFDIYLFNLAINLGLIGSIYILNQKQTFNSFLTLVVYISGNIIDVLLKSNSNHNIIYRFLHYILYICFISLLFLNIYLSCILYLRDNIPIGAFFESILIIVLMFFLNYERNNILFSMKEKRKEFISQIFKKNIS